MKGMRKIISEYRKNRDGEYDVRQYSLSFPIYRETFNIVFYSSIHQVLHYHLMVPTG